MEIETSKKTRPHGGLTHKQLLFELSAAGAENTDSSFHREFYYRFGKSLFKICSIVCSNHKADDSLTKDIFQETIIKGIKNIYTFKYEEEDSDAVIRNKVVGWLGTIAHREFINYFRKKLETENDDESLQEITIGDQLGDFEEEQHIPISLERLRLQSALATLNEKERYILIVCADYGCVNIKSDLTTSDDTTQQRHLPDDVIKRLCQELQITKGNLRAIKKRALAKLLQHLRENAST